MKITIVASGSRGDIQPYVALGVGLQDAGYEVSVACHASFEPFIRGYGLNFLPLAVNPQEALDSEAGRKMLDKGANPIVCLKILLEIYCDLLPKFLDGLWDICQDSQAMIFSVPTLPTYFIAKKLNIPCIGAYLQPFSRTNAFPSIFLSQKIKLGKSYNYLTYLFLEQLLWHPVRKIFNNWLKKKLGLAPLPFMGPYKTFYRESFPVLYGYSPIVVPRPHDWSDCLKVTGYWFLEQPPDWEPSSHLLDFLDNGPPPVYVGFGSMSNRDPEEIADIVLKSLKKNKMRGVILTGWGGMQKSDLPDDVFLADAVPHDWLFPQMAAVVHHGGAGTTAAGLRAGIPSVVVPFFTDQPFWANRVYDLGAGPKPVPRSSLNVNNLSEAIKIAATDEKIQLKASRIGQYIRAEDGIGNAVKAFSERVNNFQGY